MSTIFTNKNIFFLIFLIFFSISTNASYSWKYYERKAIVEYNNEMYDFAIENFNKAIRLSPANSFLSYKYLGLISLKNQNRNKALEYFLDSLLINDNQYDTHFLAGELEDYYWNLDKALNHFLRSIELKPDYIFSHLGAARIYSLKGNYEQSEIYFSKAFKLKQDESETAYQKAFSYYDKEQFKQAEYLLLEGLKKYPADKRFYYLISTIYRHSGKCNSAISILEKLKYFQPHSEKVYIHIANLYYSGGTSGKRKKELELAAKNILQAIKLNEKNPRNWELLSEIYNELGYYKKSKAAGEKAFDLSNNK